MSATHMCMLRGTAPTIVDSFIIIYERMDLILDRCKSIVLFETVPSALHLALSCMARIGQFPIAWEPLIGKGRH